jgi:hypothetical protein
MRMRTLIVGVAVVAMLGIGAAPALAAPIRATGAVTLTATCDSGLGAVNVVVAGNGKDVWSPAISTGQHLVLVPYNFHIVMKINGGTVETSDSVKPAPHSGRLATCTFGFTELLPGDAVLTLDFIVKVSYTPVH